MLIAVAIDDDYNVLIVTELLPKKSLDVFTLENKGRINLGTKVSILLEVAVALNYLHTLNPSIVHRDVKPKNIFISHHLAAKLGDFGWTKQTGQGVPEQPGRDVQHQHRLHSGVHVPRNTQQLRLLQAK